MSIKVSYNAEAIGESEDFELPYGTVTIKLTVQLVPNAMEAFKKIEALGAKVKSLKNKSIENITEEEIQATKIEEKVRELLKEAFGADVFPAAFGDQSCFSLNSDKKSLITAFADAFFPALESRIKAKTQAALINHKMQQQQPKPTVRPEVNKYLTSSTAVAGLAQPYKNNPLPDVSHLTPEQKQALLAQLIT